MNYWNLEKLTVQCCNEQLAGCNDILKQKNCFLDKEVDW